MVSRRLETHFLSLGLGLGLDPQSLGLGLEPFKSWSWSRLGTKSWVQDQYTIQIVVQLNRVKNDLFSGRFLMRQSCTGTPDANLDRPFKFSISSKLRSPVAGVRSPRI